MAITKKRKETLVTRYKDLMGRSQGVVLSSYCGLSVKELEALRRRVRELGGEFHVVKNKLVALALNEAGLSMSPEVMEGPTAVGFAEEDALAVAKAIVDFGRESEFVRIKGGVIDGVAYNAKQMQRLAEMPPLPVVRAQLLGLLSTPGSRLAGVVAGSIRQAINVIKAYSEKPAPSAA